jgi:hypothetical protein
MDFIEEFDTAIRLMTNDDLFKAVMDGSDDDIFEFSETLALISAHHFNTKQSVNDNFSFTANSSLSGGKHPCSVAECRVEKLNQLITFSSLYADQVYIQNPFERLALQDKEKVSEYERMELLHGIASYNQLKPLIKKGIIKYANNLVPLCLHHNEIIAKPLAESIEKKEGELYELLHEYLIDKCSINFDYMKNGLAFLEISGPEELIEHGVIYFHYFDTLPEYLNFLLKKTTPYSLTKKEIIDNELLSLVINPILKDLSNQEWHSAFHGTSYLFDKAVQAKIATKMNKSKYAANSSAFESGMQHYLPTVHSQDMKIVLNLRETEAEAFAVYRDRLNKFMRDSKSLSEQEISYIFRDQILPEINLIDKKIKDWKSKSRESLKEKVIFGSGAVAIGLYSGILPANIGEIIATIGGGTALATALMDYNKTFKEKEEARSSDFYFLWQAKNI